MNKWHFVTIKRYAQLDISVGKSEQYITIAHVASTQESHFRLYFLTDITICQVILTDLFFNQS